MSSAALPKPLPLLMKLTRHRRGLFVLSCTLWVAIHALPVLSGLIMRELFDALAGTAPAGSNPWTLLVLVLAVDAGRLLTMAAGIYTFVTYWFETVLVMRHNLLRYLLTAPGTRRLPDSSGEAVSRFRDDVEDIADYVEYWIDFWGLALFAAIALGVMAFIQPLLTVLVCLPLLVTFLLTGLLRPQIRSARREMREKTGRVTDFIGEMSGGVLALKVAGAQERVVRHFDGLNERRRKAALKDTLLTELFRSVTDNMVHVATGVILLLAATSLRDGSFSVGDFALFVAYLPRLTSIMSFLGAMLVQHKRTGVAFERLERLMHDGSSETVVAPARLYLRKGEPPRPARTESAPAFRSLEVRNLSYAHSDGTPGLTDISFTVPAGSFTVITGEVGAGKTTLLRALLGLLPRTSGEIVWNGALVEDPASFFVPPRSAYTPQVPRLFSDTLRENLVQGADVEEERIRRALRQAVFEEDVARFEGGLDTPVGSRGVKLSGGQLQRAAAARMLLRDAQLLVFDDLSSALDVNTEATLWRLLEEHERRTCLVVSHRRAALERASQIIVLQGGKVAQIGTLEELEPTWEVLKGA